MSEKSNEKNAEHNSISAESGWQHGKVDEM